jgi:hypothetical protein
MRVDVWEQLMRLITICVCLVVVASGGCARLRPTSSSAAPSGAAVVVTHSSETAINKASPTAESPGGSAASTPEVQPSSAIHPTDAMLTKNSSTAVDGPSSGAAPPAQARAAGPSAAKIKPPGSNSPANQPASSAGRATPLSKQPIVEIAPQKPPSSPALDLTALEQRLRDTHAIGVFTKLSLKNQVDDLLDQFRAYYRGQIKTPLAALRQQYDLLLLKVLTLLQDSDPPLAAAILSSREAIWSILADPEKFTKI